MAKDPKGNTVKGQRIADLQKVANQNPVGPANPDYNHIRVQIPGNKEVSLLFTDYEIRRALKRAQDNPEDCPATNVFRDFLD